METISPGKFKALKYIFISIFFVSSGNFLYAVISPTCFSSLKRDEFDSGGGSTGLLSFEDRLPTTTDPYGKDIPREVHETEKAGQLYPVGAKFDAKKDENGIQRADGRYLFAIARDMQGNRRVMVVPRFEFQKKDGKFLNTHRTMFRKYPDVFGPSPHIEVMGELEILNGTVMAYNNKAGTAYDPREATQPELFKKRVAIAESMGIDLSQSHNTVNYSVIAQAKSREESFIPGRHIEEEDFIKVAKLYHENPVTKRLIDRYDYLIKKLYELFPEEAKADPRAPLSLDKIKSPPFNIPQSEAAGLKIYLNSSQLDRPETIISRGLSRNPNGALTFSRVLDRLEYIVQTEEARLAGKVGPKIEDWSTHVGAYETQNRADVEQGHYDSLYKSTKAIFNFSDSTEDFKDFTWKVDTPYKHYLNNDYTKEQILKAQLLMGELRKKFGITQEIGGPFDYAKFIEKLKMQEDDQFVEDHIAQKMVYDLFLESEKKDGNPMRLFDEMYKKAENASEDEIHIYPYPGMVISASLRALGVTP